MQQFVEFVNRKQRETKKHLKIVEKMLKKGGLHVYSHLENEEQPYLFIKNTQNQLSFDGIRIYEIGEMVAYRVQKEEKTEPYGKAYALDVEDMYNDYLSDGYSEKNAGKKVMHSVVEDIKRFFIKCHKAEEEMRYQGQDGTGLVIKTGGTDYSGSVVNRLWSHIYIGYFSWRTLWTT